jgi:DNA primase
MLQQMSVWRQCGGNVLDFIAKKEGVSIHEAAHLAVKWFDIVLDDSPSREHLASSQRAEQPSARHQKQSVSVAAPPILKEMEPESDEPNKPLAFTLKNLDPAHAYLSERGLSSETIACFGLGHCKKGILNGRIAIPVHNGNGELVAYAGRWPGHPPDDRTKYQFPKGFRKSQEIFNLHRARQSRNDGPLIIVEGFFDCMKVWQAGIERVVALMGSELSSIQEEHIVQFVGHHGQIALMFDDDDAGLSAREQALHRFASRAYVRVIELRNFGKQPDELSTEQLRELLLLDDIGEYTSETPRFPLGGLVATPNALAQLTELDIRTALARHIRGDWGDVCEEDRQANDTALEEGTRLVSVYHSAKKVKFYLITEWDRSVTTVLLPEDY